MVPPYPLPGNITSPNCCCCCCTWMPHSCIWMLHALSGTGNEMVARSWRASDPQLLASAGGTEGGGATWPPAEIQCNSQTENIQNTNTCDENKRITRSGLIIAYHLITDQDISATTLKGRGLRDHGGTPPL